MAYRRITPVLRDEGYEVTAVADGHAGLEAAQTAQPAFDLVVTNTWTRDSSDAELINQLRVDFPTVPILQVDDFARHKSSAELRQDVTTLYKPFGITALRKAVAELLVEGMEQAVTREPPTPIASDAAPQ
jgi:DNA-binding NtrC family response regulator